MQTFSASFPPLRARTHEVCGPGAYGFASAVMAQQEGHTIWVREHWDSQHLNPAGLVDFTDPARLTVCNTAKQVETLAVAEEALRSGAASLVVLILNAPIGLTEGRRLQLAAREGNATGVSLIRDGMGSNAAETRWHCQPVFDPGGSTSQRWELIKNKSGTLGVWHVQWDPATRRIVMVPPAGK